jgi:hypothetical protein
MVMKAEKPIVPILRRYGFNRLPSRSGDDMWQFVTSDPLIAISVFENDEEGVISSFYSVDGTISVPIRIGKMTEQKIAALIEAFKVKP